MILTRQEAEKRILELYNQGKNTRYIAQELHVSFRDIGDVIDKEEQKKEAKEQQQQLSLASRAYELFSEGKTPVQVAIDLNLRQPQVTELYKECWNLNNLHSLNQAYKELNGNIEPFLKLHRLIKAAGMNTQHVIKLLKIANNDIASVEYRLKELKVEEASLQADNRNSARTFQELSSHISITRHILEQYESSCKERRLEVDNLNRKYTTLHALVNYFKDNNEEYLKIRKTAEEKVLSILSDSKMVLRYALSSLTETMRNDPDKYSTLIYQNTSSTTDSQHYSYSYMSGPYIYEEQQQQQYQSQDYNIEALLIEEAEKLYNKLAKEVVDKIISDYAVSISSSSPSSLPLLPSPDKQQEG